MTPTDQTPLGAGLADQTLRPTPASEWNRKEQPTDELGFIAELPSGNVVRMTRTMDMQMLLRTGKIPNPLAGIVQGMIDVKTDEFPTDMGVDSLMQLLDLMNETCYRSLIDPVFDMPEKRKKGESAEKYQERLEEWTPAEGTISVWDLTPDDRHFIFAVSQGAAADLAKFREESERALASFQTGKRVPKPTKRTGGARSKK